MATDEIVFESTLPRLALYCSGPFFEKELDDFRNKYKTKFQDFFNNESKSNESKSNKSKLDSKSSDSVDAIKEYPLEFYEIFCKYQSLLESLLEEYARRNNMKQDAIFLNAVML